MMRSTWSSSDAGPESSSEFAFLSTAMTTSGTAFVSATAACAGAVGGLAGALVAGVAAGALVVAGLSGSSFSTTRTVPRDIWG